LCPGQYTDFRKVAFAQSINSTNADLTLDHFTHAPENDPKSPSNAMPNRRPSQSAIKPATANDHPPYRSDACQCLGKCARLLLHISSHTAPKDSGTYSIDKLISIYKAGARELSVLYQCSACASRSENMMVVALVMQQMSTLCELMVEQHVRGGGAGEIEVCFGQFQIEGGSERDSVSLAIISLQCREFATLFAKMKARAVLMPGPIALLQSAEAKLNSCQKAIMQRLADSCESLRVPLNG
jgi:hypothetical protein